MHVTVDQSRHEHATGAGNLPGAGDPPPADFGDPIRRHAHIRAVEWRRPFRRDDGDVADHKVRGLRPDSGSGAAHGEDEEQDSGSHRAASGLVSQRTLTIFHPPSQRARCR
jgi:hypothetical protein